MAIHVYGQQNAKKNADSAPEQNLFQPRPFAVQRQSSLASPEQQETPDLQTQLERAERFGHNFGRVQVQADTPAVMQRHLGIGQSDDQQYQQETDGLVESVKVMPPPIIGKPIQREVEEDESIQMRPKLGWLTPSIQRQEQEDESIQMKPIQLKLAIGAPGDKYEQEADEMADQVMSMASPVHSPPVQRQAAPEEEEVQTKPVAASITPLVQREVMPESEEVQAKPLTTGTLQREAIPDEEEPVQTKPLANTLQREAVPEAEEPVQTKPSVQRATYGNLQAGGNLESQLNSSKGGGNPLPDEVRSFMEPRFGADFSQVRVHTGSEAVQMNQDLNAQAFTQGSDIYFGAGKSAAKDDLTAHELTHVVQQTGKVQRQSRGAAAATAPPPVPQKTRTIEGSAGSVSWIDPSSKAGSGRLGVPDPAPATTITESFITGSSGFRFSNYLHGYLTTNDSVTIASSGLYGNSGIYSSPSQFGLTSERLPIIHNQTNVTRGGIQGIQFQQLVGARTISAGVAAGGTGAVVGGVAGGVLGGLAAGGKLGGALGSVVGPLGTAGGAILGGALGAGIGYFAGTAVANTIPQTNFPPIWTEIRLTIMADGTRDFQLLRHSLFPSNSFYSNPVGANTLVRTSNHYDAKQLQEKAWQNSGWGSGNPWGTTRPTFTP
jgi:hypothetical protein